MSNIQLTNAVADRNNPSRAGASLFRGIGPLVELAESLALDGYDISQGVIGVIECEPHAYDGSMHDLLLNLLENRAKVAFLGTDYPAEQVRERISAHRETMDDIEYEVVYGNRRTVAMLFAEIMGEPVQGIGSAFHVLDVDADEALRANEAENLNKLRGLDKLDKRQAFAIMWRRYNAGEIKAEKDIPAKRGAQQQLFGLCQLADAYGDPILDRIGNTDLGFPGHQAVLAAKKVSKAEGSTVNDVVDALGDKAETAISVKEWEDYKTFAGGHAGLLALIHNVIKKDRDGVKYAIKDLAADLSEHHGD